MTRASASGYGSGLMRTVSTSENTAVVTPAPKASVSTAAVKNAGRLANDRHACCHAHIWIRRTSMCLVYAYG